MAEVFRGLTLSSVAGLADLPDPSSEPLLVTMCESLDRIVQAAYCSVSEDRVNIFDQVRIDSFMQRPRASDRPLLVKLQKPIYAGYKSVWKGLICFVCRYSEPGTPFKLKHRLSIEQATCLDRLIESAQCYVGQVLRPRRCTTS